MLKNAVHLTNAGVIPILLFSVTPLLTFFGCWSISSIIFRRAFSPRNITIGFFAAVTVMTVLLVLMHGPYNLTAKLFFLGFMLLVSLSAFQINRLLGVWTTVSWLPHLMLYVNEVHLMYALGPVSMTILWYIKIFLNYTSVNRDKAYYRITRWLVMAGLIFVVCDHLLNLKVVYQAFNDVNLTSRKIAALIVHDGGVAPEMTIVANTPLGADIRYHLQTSFPEMNINIGYTHGVSLDAREDYANQGMFDRLLELVDGGQKGYLVDTQYTSQAMRDFLNQYRERTQLVAVAQNNFCWNYVDPLKYLIQDNYASYPGPADIGRHVVVKKFFLLNCDQTQYRLYRLKPAKNN